jgi:Cu/Ag efflux pump CusA
MVNQRGAAITLGDVADIRLGPEMRRGVGEFDGEGCRVRALVGAALDRLVGDEPIVAAAAFVLAAGVAPAGDV